MSAVHPILGLGAEDFPEFFEQIHGHAPFPWQSALVHAVLVRGSWPSLVDVPTGLGKTSLLDVAVFVAAATAGQNRPDRVGRRRCLFVVDRRVVVDEATAHARKIVAALAGAEAVRAEGAGQGGALARAAQGLRLLGGTRPGEGELVSVTRMRGGTSWSTDWAQRPDRPGIVVSTVDQVGSRLLFRGYGVSERRRSIDAALVGTDALLLVDEAHLATALLRTLGQIAARDRTAIAVPGLAVVQLTATAARTTPTPPTAEEAGQWVLPLDLGAHQAVAEAARRLDAAKTLYLREVPARKAPAELARAARTLAHARPGDGGGRAPAVLVVCNTVDRARAVHDELVKNQGAGAAGLDVELLIGRSRPVDRARREQEILARFGIGAARTERPAVLVSTQTVEVGVNLDVDALVSESASWDALVQRLGRLNRLGRHGERFPGAHSAVALIVHDGQLDGPVYGAARDRTWEHLRSLTEPVEDLDGVLGGQAQGVGVSPAQCRDLTERVPAEAYLAAPHSPIVTAPVLDRWARTAPVPANDPPIEDYLHGFGTSGPSVSLVWRERLLAPTSRVDLDAAPVEHGEEWLEDLLTAAPPRAGETVEVPLAAVRRWAGGQRPSPVSDLEILDEPEPSGRPEREPFEVLVRREDPRPARRGARSPGPGWRWVDAVRLRPGDVVLVPAERGGLDAFGWNPAHIERVPDVSEAAATDSGRLLLYLDRTLGRRLHLPPAQAKAVAVLAGAISRILAGDQDEEIDPRTRSGEEPSAPIAEASGTDEFPEGELAAAPGGREPLDDDQFADIGVEVLTRRLLQTVAEGLHAAPNVDPAQGGPQEWADPGRRERLSTLVNQGVQARGTRAPRAVLVGSDPWEDPEDLHGRRSADAVVLGWRPARADASPAPGTISGRGHGALWPQETDGDGIERSEDDPTASSLTPTGARVSLHVHLAAVRERARQIAEHLGLSDELTAVLADAAGWHDLGKAEDRFQAMLHGGDPYAAAIAVEPLAKSGMDPQDRQAWRLARLRAGLPAGARHEAWSAALVAHHVAEHGYVGDADLLVHLVASHHGHARPLLPLVVDDDPRPVHAAIDNAKVQVDSAHTIDLDHPGRFAALNQRYGRWGLALLEAVVRCADMTISAEGS